MDIESVAARITKQNPVRNIIPTIAWMHIWKTWGDTLYVQSPSRCYLLILYNRRIRNTDIIPLWSGELHMMDDWYRFCKLMNPKETLSRLRLHIFLGNRNPYTKTIFGCLTEFYNINLIDFYKLSNAFC